MNKKRAIILNTAIIFSFFLVFFRLADLMIFNHERLEQKAKRQYTKSEDIQVRRGLIFDRTGRELALNLELESLFCDPEKVRLNTQDVRKLTSVISQEPRAFLAKIPEQGRFAWIQRKLEPQTAEKVRKLNLKGFYFLPEAKRFYPREQLASHILGFTGIDNQALEGIELKYDKHLTTAGGKVYFRTDAGGNALSSGVDIEAQGNNLVLTIDEVLQSIAEKEIDSAMSKWKASAASVIIMDPYTGEILAMANRPTYNPNTGNRAKAYTRRNRAVTDCFEPGSTFKLVVGVAALEEKIYKPTSFFDVSKGSIEIGGKTIRDTHKNKALSFKEIIQKSSNVGSIKVGLRLGKDRVYKYARLLGFGAKTGIDLPGEVSGWIYPPEKWSGTSIGAISIGQEVAVTALQVLRAYATVANGGYLVKPHVVSQVLSPHGDSVYTVEIKRKRVISSRTAESFREILRSVTDEQGTGANAAIEGNDVAGKTGTAQMINPQTKQYSKEKYISSFVGFVPAHDPRLAMIVVIYEPKGKIYGGVVAAPVFREIATRALSYIGVPRQDMLRYHAMFTSR